MRKSLVKDYELDRKFDFGEYWSPSGKRFTKRRAHRRYRATQKDLLKKFFDKNKNF